jgi:tetratricopeptide (TPR) repeat protein
MSDAPPPPMCFVAMPFGKKPPPGKKKPLIDFNHVYSFFERAVVDVGLECVRADFEATGGFIHRPMYERLLVAEYVVADLTLANANVMYEVGVRHGSRAKRTLLVCAGNFVNQLPFDIKPLRVLTYPLEEAGHLSDSAGAKLREELSHRLHQAIAGDLPPDNPILQVTAFEPSSRVEHEKTDVFLRRMRYASEMGERVHAALNRPSPADAVAALQAIEQEVLAGPQVVAQLHTALIALYLGYREKKAYPQMVALFDKLPRELQRTPVAIEQLALALNRLAEAKADTGDLAGASQLRREALGRLGRLAAQEWSSETYGIAGRIYKGQAEAELKAGHRSAAEGALQRAIETYEQGFRLDPRDYYPGVNAATLRLRRGFAEDLEALAVLVPAVRFSVDRAPAPKDDMERYWQEATKLELACAAQDWRNAHTRLPGMLALDVPDWARETTIKNLEILKQALAADATAITALDEIITALKP